MSNAEEKAINEAHLYMIKGVVSDMSEEDQLKIQELKTALRNIFEGSNAAKVAWTWLNCELIVEGAFDT